MRQLFDTPVLNIADYEQVSMTDAQTMLPDCATGNGNAILANRISFAFDLRGTSQTIDTGCSGGLVAVHQAVQDLFLGNSNMVCFPQRAKDILN